MISGVLELGFGVLPNKQSEPQEAAERRLGYPKGYPNPLLAKTPDIV